MKILVTGAAGFIGSKLCYELCRRGDDVVGVDNLNHYYDPRLKEARLRHFGNELLPEGRRWRFVKLDIADKEQLDELFAEEHFDRVVNLAAQAGVRYSISHPYTYMESNLKGFLNVLEACRHFQVKYLVYASSSSIYGLNKKVPYSEADEVVSPVSLYAASKKSNELMAHAYSRLYGIATTGLRYFTVYGPWGRPDMAPMLFASAIREGRPIKVFNNGDMWRDFTYIDDIVEGTIRVVDQMPVGDECQHGVLANIYNIGCGHPVRLMDFIAEIEKCMGREAIKEYLPMQAGDVYQTWADTSKLSKERDYRPTVLLHEGIPKFVEWYMSNENLLLG